MRLFVFHPYKITKYRPCDLAEISSSIDQNTVVQHTMWIEPTFDCLQGVGKEFKPLVIIPSSVTSTERAMVRDCGAT